MSSRHEERAFARIADRIVADDPRFARSVRRLQGRRPGRVHDVVLVVAVASAVLCVLLSLPAPAFVAASLAYVTFHCRPTRPRRRAGRRRHDRRPGGGGRELPEG